MSDNYCSQCFDLFGIESVIYDESDYCEKCIHKYNMMLCDLCDKYKMNSLFGGNKSICLNCQWKSTQTCQNCKNDKPIMLFLNNIKYCGDCQYTMLCECQFCAKKVKYYQLDLGRFCTNCQYRNECCCSGCEKSYSYQDFCYSKNRTLCKECVINDFCRPFNLPLIKYELN